MLTHFFTDRPPRAKNAHLPGFFAYARADIAVICGNELHPVQFVPRRAPGGRAKGEHARLANAHGRLPTAQLGRKEIVR